jgi:hypothetical protein
MDPHTTSLTMTKLQNPIKTAFDKVTEDLRQASSSHKKIGRALDKNFPIKELPPDDEKIASRVPLINRAIAMHLLREGQFSVASTFIEEVQKKDPRNSSSRLDDQMDEDDKEEYHDAFPHANGYHHNHEDGDYPVDEDEDYDDDEEYDDEDEYDLSSLHSQELQDRFAEMYRILQQLKAHNLLPAIDWARANSAELEARGSNLEFELSKLQYVWLFLGPAVNGFPDDENNGRAGALAYARRHFHRFQDRHLREIQQLASAMLFAPNLADSPYHDTFTLTNAFTDVASSFTREFCSLLGLSAESPLYLAVTAGALALPRQMKYMQATRAKGTEWTTEQELPFETPLPESMLFHSIFVCPVSKEQTTESNPPMVIPCGHMLARETLEKLCKGNRFKCPYCPSEGQLKDARRVIL